jgi:acyl carrier protein
MQTSEIIDRVYRVLHNELDIEGTTITPNMHLMNDLGADSLGGVEIIMCMEDEFGITIPDEKIDQIIYVEDIVKTVGELVG